MYMTLDDPASREKISTRFDSGVPRIMMTAHADATINATAMGIL